MSKHYTLAQRKAIAAKAKQRAALDARIDREITGRGAYRSKPVAVRRKPARIKGNGDYKASVGYQIGSAIGGALGYGAQHLIKYMTGFGDYKISHNSLMGGVYDPPELRNLRDRGVVVRHREYIADIVASSSFTNTAYPINPGLGASFPWLSQVAEAFEEYYITGMVYEYKTLSADYTTASSAALGYVVMATQYNVLNVNFPDKKTMENYEFSNSAKPSESFIHPIECKKSVTPVSELFVRTGAIPSGADQRLYDQGTFQIATGGNSGSGILGELWVTFEIVFCKPKLVTAIGYQLLTDHFQLQASSVTNSKPLSAAAARQAGSNIGCTISAAGVTIVFPASVNDGNYLLTYNVSGDSGSVVAPAITTSAGVSLLSIWKNDTVSNVSNTGGSTTTTFIMMFIIQIVASSVTVSFGTGGTLLANITSGDLWITQINGSIAT